MFLSLVVIFPEISILGEIALLNSVTGIVKKQKTNKQNSLIDC